jgi:hypothetical protein
MVCYLGGAFYPKWVCGAGMCGDRALRIWTHPRNRQIDNRNPGRVLKNDFKGIDMLEKWLLRLDSNQQPSG